MKYDLIIIGAGPAGYSGGITAGALGRKVLVIDKREPGGTCLYSGCVPSSYVYQAALFLSRSRNFEKKRIFQNPGSVNWEELQKQKRDLIQSLQKGINFWFRKNSVEFRKGEARITEDGSVILGNGDREQEFFSEKILIATGSSENIPPVLTGLPHMTGESVWNMERLPEDMAVIGAGVVGAETAFIFSSFGVKVTLIEVAGEILPFLDDDLRKVVLSRLRDQGVRILTNALVEGGSAGDGTVRLNMKNHAEIRTRQLVVSAGRKPDTGVIRDVAGIKMKNGFIEVERDYRTSRNNLFAAGDVINEGRMFAHLARQQARDCVRLMYEAGYVSRSLLMPYGIFTYPQVAGIGMTEKELAAAGHPYQVKKVSSLATSAGKIHDLKDGFLKLLLSRKEKKILGVHLAAENAVELISVLGLWAGSAGNGDPELFDRALFLHPSESEIFSEIFFPENEK